MKNILTSFAFIFLTRVAMAAISSVPMAMGLPCGRIVFSVAVLAILITAPLGALGKKVLLIFAIYFLAIDIQ